MEERALLSLRAEPDPTRPLGHARIVLEGMPRPPADAKFRIRREGYPSPNLGLHGWQVREERLPPVQVAVEDGQTVLVVGPSVTRHLEPAPYLFALPAAGVEEPLFWPDTIDVFDGEVPTEAPAPAPEPAAVPTPPDRSPPAAAPPATTAPAPPPPVAPPPARDTAAPTPPARGAETGRGRMPVLLGLGALLLAVLGGGAWWLLSGEAPPRVEEAAPTRPAPAPATPPAAAVPSPVPTWPDGTDGMTLREVVERAPNAAGIYAAALRRQVAGRHDDALVLFEEAADRGYAPASTALARLYDPNGFVPGRPFRNPDPRAAARYYRDAAQRGDAGAEAPRAALRGLLEEQARAGNGTAETALREFWP